MEMNAALDLMLEKKLLVVDCSTLFILSLCVTLLFPVCYFLFDSCVILCVQSLCVSV